MHSATAFRDFYRTLEYKTEGQDKKNTVLR